MKTTPARRGAGMIAAGALVAGALAALPATAAHAAPSTTNYSCAFTGGPYDAGLVVNAAAPAQVKQGETLSLTASASVAWGSKWSNSGREYNMKFKEVSADVAVLVNGVALEEGDYIFLPAHCRHRVAWTRSQPPTVWLAIHLFTKC